MKYQLVPTNNTASESSSVVSGSDSVTDDDLELKSFRPILPSNNQKKKTETNTFLQLNSSENEKEENILKKTLLKQNKDDEVHIAPSKDPYPRYQSDPNYEKKQIFSNENYGSGTYPSISNNNNNISYPHPIAAFCVVCLGYGFSLLITYLCFKIFNKDNSQKDFVYLGMYGVSTLFFSLTINAFCLIRKYDPYSIFRFYKPEGPRLILVFSSIIPILMMSLYFFITVVAGIYRNAKEEGLSEMHVAGFWNAIVIIVTTALIPGFCEEIIFRGFLQKTLEFYFRTQTIPIITCSFFYAFLHIDYEIGMIILRFIMGIFFGFLATRVDSIFPGILAHILSNCFFVFYFNLYNSAVGHLPGSIAILFVIVLILAIAYVFYLFFKKVPNAGNGYYEQIGL